ncbi:hypothetical protein CEXT_598721 [Caerostris extrusa]|uniref:Uncharacterized protein n=1 Tax=Caerostris extrusa TaxID=172846 RepID=A0AAV4USK3_CAEEX|nr:hypothetical protein CEXT_598721 [Caerostris extrusa]
MTHKRAEMRGAPSCWYHKPRIAAKGMSSRTSLNTSRRNIKYERPMSRSGSRYGPINRIVMRPEVTLQKPTPYNMLKQFISLRLLTLPLLRQNRKRM